MSTQTRVAQLLSMSTQTGVAPLPSGPIVGGDFGVDRPRSYVRPRIDYRKREELIRRGEIRARMEERKKEIDELTDVLAVAHQQAVKWRAKQIALENRVTHLNNQQDRDLELNARLREVIDREWDEDLDEVESDEEVHEIREIGVVDLSVMIDDISDRDVGLEGLEPDTEPEDEDN